MLFISNSFLILAKDSLKGPGVWLQVGSKFLRRSVSEKLMALSKIRRRSLRAEREGSRAKLTVQVGVWRQTINSIEKGTFHPNLWLAFKIARGFGKRVEEMLI
jgi:putative transcriptional regulator